MSAQEGPVASAERASGAGSLALYGVFLLATALLLHDVLHQPPVWDTSTGLFPAAIVLADNGFDLPDLLSRPGWAHGGPNIHQFSLVTWLTALVLRALPERELWLPLLHALHFAMAAGTLLGAFRLGRALLPPALALGSVAVLLLFPLFQVQAGYLYTEMPLALCTVWAVEAAARRRRLRAALFSALACSVKEAGLVVPAALAVAAALESGPAAVRAGRVAAFALPAAVFVGLQLGFAVPVEASFGVRPIPYTEQLRDVLRKLAVVPDWAALLAVFAVSAARGLPASWRTLRGSEAAAEPARRVRALSLLVVGAFAGFYLLVPLTGVEVYVLPRYYVQIAPLVLLGCVDAAHRAGGVRLAGGLLAVLAGLFLLNRSGALYPPVSGNEFSLAERSTEYRDLLEAKRELLQAAAALPGDLPVFYGLTEHFLFAYPRMGYADGPPAAGRCIWLDARSRGANLADFPEHFAILYDFVGYGGVQLQSLVRQARADPGRRVRATAFERGRYRTLLFEITSAR